MFCVDNARALFHSLTERVPPRTRDRPAECALVMGEPRKGKLAVTRDEF
jgi:hypothetical protein